MNIYNAKSYLVRKTNSTAMKLLSEHLTIDHTHPLKCILYVVVAYGSARRFNQSIPKGNQSWIFIGRTLCKELTHWQRPWCWERLKAGKRYDRGWDGRMASPIQWTWVWLDSGSWWRTEARCATSHGVAKSDTTKRLNWTDGMVGWHHWLSGHKYEQTPGVGEGQGSLACCSWVTESDMT